MDTFVELAPRIMRELMATFALSAQDAAAIVGNAGHECGGFRLLQEVHPVVHGSLGGWGWFQWTGPRRRNFMAWAEANKLKPDSYEANFGFLKHELLTDYKYALINVHKASNLYNKVVAFEEAFEKAGVKAYPSRYAYAQKALFLYLKNPDPHLGSPKDTK